MNPGFFNSKTPVLRMEITGNGAVGGITYDSIRLLAWMKTHAPQAQVHVVANRITPAGQPEIARKDLETSIEHRIDHAIPLDAKLACLAAKLGKPMAEAGRGGKTAAPLIQLMNAVVGSATAEGGAKPARPGSLVGRLGDLKGLLAKRPAKAKAD